MHGPKPSDFVVTDDSVRRKVEEILYNSEPFCESEGGSWDGLVNELTALILSKCYSFDRACEKYDSAREMVGEIRAEQTSWKARKRLYSADEMKLVLTYITALEAQNEELRELKSAVNPTQEASQ